MSNIDSLEVQKISTTLYIDDVSEIQNLLEKANYVKIKTKSINWQFPYSINISELITSPMSHNSANVLIQQIVQSDHKNKSAYQIVPSRSHPNRWRVAVNLDLIHIET